MRAASMCGAAVWLLQLSLCALLPCDTIAKSLHTESLPARLGPSNPKAASWSSRRALLTPQNQSGSCYRRGKCT